MILLKSLLYESNIFKVFTRSEKTYKSLRKHEKGYIDFYSDNFTDISDVKNLDDYVVTFLKNKYYAPYFYRQTMYPFSFLMHWMYDEFNINQISLACEYHCYPLIKRILDTYERDDCIKTIIKLCDITLLQKIKKYFVKSYGSSLWREAIKTDNIEIVQYALENFHITLGYFPKHVQSIKMVKYLLPYYEKINKKILNWYFMNRGRGIGKLLREKLQVT